MYPHERTILESCPESTFERERDKSGFSLNQSRYRWKKINLSFPSQAEFISKRLKIDEDADRLEGSVAYTRETFRSFFDDNGEVISSRPIERVTCLIGLKEEASRLAISR